MPLLAGLLLNLFSGIVGFFAQYLTKKVALGAAAVAVIAGLTISMVAAAKLLVIGVLVTVPQSAALVQGFNMVMPSNFIVCLAAIASAHTGIALYKWNMENVKILSYIT
jgi:hypothetical protein